MWIKLMKKILKEILNPELIQESCNKIHLVRPYSFKQNKKQNELKLRAGRRWFKAQINPLDFPILFCERVQNPKDKMEEK